MYGMHGQSLIQIKIGNEKIGKKQNRKELLFF